MQIVSNYLDKHESKNERDKDGFPPDGKEMNL